MSEAMQLSDLDLDGVFAGEVVATEAVAAPATTRTRAASKRTSTDKSNGTSTARGLLYFDLETIPDFERLERFGLPPLPEARDKTPHDKCTAIHVAAGCTLDQLTKLLASENPCDEWLAELHAAESDTTKPRKGVFDAIDKCRGEAAAIEAAVADRNKLLAVTPEFNRIVAVGWAVGAGDTQSLVARGDITERQLLVNLWDLIGDATTVVGFNILHFDLPTVFIRSALLGVKPSRLLDLKAWGRDCLDLFAARHPRGGKGRLKDLAAYYGFEVPAGDFDGGQVLAAYEAEKFEEIGLYVRSDVEISRKLHQFYSGYFCA